MIQITNALKTRSTRRFAFSLLSISFFVLGILAAPLGHAKDGHPLELTEGPKLEFFYGYQDGEMTVPCDYKLNPRTLDFELTCGEAGKQGGVSKFTAHVRVKVFEQSKSPKMSYEVLYWIQDHQIPWTENGHFQGTTFWFRLDEPSQLMSIDVSQDVQKVKTVRMRLKLR